MLIEIQRLLRHSAIYGTATIASKAIGFLMIPIYTRYLTPKEYGILGLFSVFTSIISTILAMGLSQATLRFYFEYKDENQRKEVISTALLSGISISIVSLLLLQNLTGMISHYLFNSIEYSYLVRFVLIILFFELSMEIPLAFVRATENSLFFVSVALARLVIGLSLNILFIVFLQKGILGAIYSDLISSLVASMVLVGYTFRYTTISFSIQKLKELLYYGIPLIFASFGMITLNMSDRIFLKYYSSLDIIGLYSLGYKFGTIINVLLFQPFWRSYGPFRFSIMKQVNAKEIYSRVLTYSLFVMVFAGMCISILIREIIVVMASPSFIGAYKVVPVIVMSYIFYVAYYLFQIGLYLQKKTKQVSYILTGVAIVNLILNWLLIPKYNMMGAAWATFLSFFLLAAITNIVSQKLYHIEYESVRIVKILITAFCLYFLSLTLEGTDVIQTMGMKILIIASYPVILYFAGFYKKSEIEKLLEFWNMGILFVKNPCGYISNRQ